MSRAFKLIQQVSPKSLRLIESTADVGIDLGSYQTRVMTTTDAEPMIVPSCLVQTRESGKIVSIGQDAREIVGRNAPDLEVVSPVKEGNFTDYSLARVFLEYCFKGAVPRKLFFFVSPNLNEVHHRALMKITKDLGVQKTILLIRPLIASLAKQVVPELHSVSSLQLLIDCGYESTNFSILQFGKVINFHQVWYGGKDLTQEIQRILKIKYHIEIGAQSAEKLKQECANVLKTEKEQTKKEYLLVVRGRDVMNSLPKSIKLSVEEFRPLFMSYVKTILDQLTIITEELGPELIEELIHRGFLVFGGMAVVNLLIQQIEDQYGTLVHRPKYPDLLYHQGFKEFLQLSSSDQRKFYFDI